MIYQIYIKCHDDKYIPSLHLHNESRTKQTKNTFRSKSKQLLPYRIPEDHYDLKKITHSLHQLNHHVKQNKENNTYLATKILFSHGKQETRKFLHRTKQLFGDKSQALKKRAIMATAPNTVHNSRETSPIKQVQKLSVKNEELYFQTFRPDFTIRTKKQPIQIRQERRKTLGIDDADIKNYESSRRGLQPDAKRKERKKRPKDFRKLNMKGFAAKISATLQSKQKVSTKTLARLMNLNVKCLGDGSLRKRCA